MTIPEITRGFPILLKDLMKHRQQKPRGSRVLRIRESVDPGGTTINGLTQGKVQAEGSPVLTCPKHASEQTCGLVDLFLVPSRPTRVMDCV